MKFSEDTDDHRKSNIDYVNQRWKQLHSLEVQFGSEGIKYLFMANAGAAIAVLAFHAVFSAGGSTLWPKLMLGLFVTGMILTGVLYFARFLGADALFKHWQDSVIAYFNDTSKWSDVVNEDIEKSRKLSWAVYLAYASFTCFVIGTVIGVLTFSKQPGAEIQNEKVAHIPTPPKANEVLVPLAEQNNKAQVTEKISEAPAPAPVQHHKERVKKVAPAEQHNKAQSTEKVSETKPETPAAPPPEKPKPEKKSFFNFFGNQ
jgi:hypothetical protein